MTNNPNFGGLLSLLVALPIIGVTIKQIEKIGDDIEFRQNRKEVKNANT